MRDSIGFNYSPVAAHDNLNYLGDFCLDNMLIKSDPLYTVCGGGDDSVRNFAVEGTPLALSNSGSQTNLSALTVDKDGGDDSDSEGDAGLLEAVAQRGERPFGAARHPVRYGLQLQLIPL